MSLLRSNGFYSSVSGSLEHCLMECSEEGLGSPQPAWLSAAPQSKERRRAAASLPAAAIGSSAQHPCTLRVSLCR